MRILFLLKTIPLILFVFLASCSSVKVPEKHSREYQVGSYLWQQRSAEYKALCYQAYNVAQVELKKQISKRSIKKKAIILDIDETVFDNSRSATYELKNNLPWSPESFNQWVREKKAIAMAGAKEFITFAYNKHIEAFYITNRTENQINDTVDNFKSLGIPIKRENILLMNSNWSKELRRKEIEKKYDVVIYVGDNLHDFNADWDKKPSDERIELVEKHAKDFGTKYIIIPNPLYGDWETSLPKSAPKTDLLLFP